MNTRPMSIHKSVNWGRQVLSLVLVLALLVPWARLNSTPAQAARVQPVLLAMAAEQPEAIVGVIVQKTVRDTRVEDLVARLGGTVTQDLSIINAFAAELPGRAVRELEQAPGVKRVSYDAPVYSTGAPSHTKFTTWATQLGTVVVNRFTNSANMLGGSGPNRTYGYGSQVKGAFAGFLPEYTPGLSIVKIEAALRVYTSAALAPSETPKLTAYVGKTSVTTVVAPATLFAGCSASAPCTLYFVITGTRAWKWSDLPALQILIDQTLVAKSHKLYYDAVGVRITTATGADTSSPLVLPSGITETTLNTTALGNAFNAAVRAPEVWNDAPAYRQGAGVTVAVVDSGSYRTNAIGARLIGEVNFNATEHNSNDGYGHGTFVTSLVADDGAYSAGKYMGIAPKVNILGVRVSDDLGMSKESDVVNALQWIYQNHAAYNIKVVNISLNSSVADSYDTSPLDAACEILWFNRIVVVVSAGNSGAAALYPPANDPFVITVGAVDDKGTAGLADDTIASFSAYGSIGGNTSKPDLVAPGVNLIAYLPDSPTLSIGMDHPENRVDADYFWMSGTSMAAPLVSGAAAMLLEDEPNLAPDQVKYRLKATANSNWPGYNSTKAGAGTLDVYAAVHGTTQASANTGYNASRLLRTGSQPPAWGSVSWDSVSWDSVSWDSVSWDSVSWDSVSWDSDYWGR